ncbi:DUF1840 domain-containing protein [Photobacterium alginatilyticum]|uniref:DUF1840 domain-containing protein n=1 Tax=Photobacterium alginatilyticum TaxID=1775171 RepID=A0ABW9YE05_9GAMM|nr:DUF1840 domain-containing protein [Photobacterium alginatilyticum]NBI52020.1 DUF1840 domain-containing protein [Photobacterium alginatilyticum]
MLVTFSCKVSGNVVMFGDVAKQMLRMMGQCENIPGAIDAEHISVALSNLEQAAGRIHQLELDSREHGELQEQEVDACDEQDVEPVISLNTRALPLIDMLKAAEKEQCYIMWE